MNVFKPAFAAVVLFAGVFVARAQETGQTGDASCPL